MPNNLQPQYRRGIFYFFGDYMHGIITNHMLLWGSLFRKTWDSLSLTEKLIWFFFLNQTIAVITLIEFILLKK